MPNFSSGKYTFELRIKNFFSRQFLSLRNNEIEKQRQLAVLFCVFEAAVRKADRVYISILVPLGEGQRLL